MRPITAPRQSTIADLVRRSAQRTPDAVAVEFADRVWTYAQWDTAVTAVARHLLSLGLAPGDRVAAYGANSDVYALLFLGSARAGLIHVPINYQVRGEELDYFLTDSGAAAVFADADLAERVTDTPTGATLPVRTLEDLVTVAAEDNVEPQGDGEFAAQDTDIAQLLYTSGTTSAPKGAMLTHMNMVSQTINTNRMSPAATADDVSMVVVPLFHIAGLGFIYPALLNAGRTVIAPPQVLMKIDALADLVEEERVTRMFLVPTLWQALCSLPGIRERNLPLTGATWGASPASRETLQLMADTFPNAVISAAFGQTEMSPTTCAQSGEESFRKMGSVGQPIGMVAARVVDPLGQDVPQGETGEVVYRGPGYMQGYWNKPEQTAEATAGGWFHSGDLVRVDEDGYYYVVDRAKDIIISGGENISSVEVEQAVAAHPKVADACVIGASHPTWVETPVAIVVPADPQDPPTLEEVQDFVIDRIASFKKPTRLEVVDELPRNASGKLQKHILRKEYATEE